MKNNFPLSEKYIDFINTTENVDADFLEGTTASGKTTVGAGVKFMLMVSKSNKKLHIIASKTTGTAEKNIIQQDNGILDIHKGKARYCGNGDKDYKIPHIKFEDKIIFVLGYDNRDKWELVLGSQFGCVYIDEINTADIDFVREISTRNDYLIATLNPDDPNLDVYKEFINRSRPYKKYRDDVPKEIIEELKEEPVPKWRYWFFTFYDNLSLTEEDIEKKKRSAPKGTKLYKNKIQGLRGRATGLIFSNFERKYNVITKDQAKKMRFVQFTAALDTSYSQKSPDTFAMSFQGITENKELVMLDEEVYSNKDLTIPLAPSDIAPKFFKFLEKNRKEWGFARDVFIDSADQATIMELKKYKRHNPNLYNIVNSYKKFEIIDRIHTMLGWINTDGKIYYYVVDTCKEHIREMEIYSWKEDKYEPEDANDHTINSGQYGWIPFRKMIGNYKEE
ncbi:PBSX family phage terminase large subunit [Clostridium beijerinckii]|uniref:terminase n=1 Tax=Clostridium beijerinckii TaxID=1520 RepID=UPI0014947551|nr:terminase [Clostridium beijerinckii]NOW84290.1 PBSX family phage terminase large subunit [Clostridium beijerinckii]